MARDTLDNRAGEHIVFLRTGRDTNGALLEFDAYLDKGAPGPPRHLHMHQEERFQVLSGAMHVSIGDRDMVLNEGGEATVPPGTPHSWDNVGETVLHARVQLTPALGFEDFLRRSFELTASNDGVLDFEALAPLLAEFEDEYRLV
jgi:mannose-6-phosphate isomerase-like protein (cupin superfamily)